MPDAIAPDTASLLAAYDAAARRPHVAALPTGVIAEEDGPLTRVWYPERGFVSTPADLGVTGPELDALIARQRDAFTARGRSLEWKTWDYDTPADLPERLRAAGFAAEDPETVLVAEVDALLQLPTDVPEGLTVRETCSEQDARRVAELQTEIWGDDWSWLAEDLFSRSQGEQPLVRILVAEEGDRMVAAGWLSLVPESGFAGLWGGSTLPTHRRRGVYRCLVARRAQLAAGLGVRYLQVDASPDSRPLLERFGFVAVATTTPFVYPAP
ncbi:GNAT family N-acetyltransferase [Kineococcus rubinsiae]|uniref:GNAT family N-acetyltransferase n=1 Tax=Kineococcus rubinsiae TaxID=2609562 RepID=UPI001AD915EE|nr:GNAT family N-acetyltransferase [Kineococcus rubinsiae]